MPATTPASWITASGELFTDKTNREVYRGYAIVTPWHGLRVYVNIPTDDGFYLWSHRSVDAARAAIDAKLS